MHLQDIVDTWPAKNYNKRFQISIRYTEWLLKIHNEDVNFGKTLVIICFSQYFVALIEKIRDANKIVLYGPIDR